MDWIEASALLGVEGKASPDEIRAAYRESLKQWHPDRFAADPVGAVEASEQTRRIVEAYRTLSAARPRPGADHDGSAGVPTFWRQLNPFDASHYRYSPNTVWDGVVIAGIVVVGIVLLVVLGT